MILWIVVMLSCYSWIKCMGFVKFPLETTKNSQSVHLTPHLPDGGLDNVEDGSISRLRTCSIWKKTREDRGSRRRWLTVMRLPVCWCVGVSLLRERVCSNATDRPLSLSTINSRLSEAESSHLSSSPYASQTGTIQTYRVLYFAQLVLNFLSGMFTFL